MGTLVKILCGGYGAPRPNGKGKRLILSGQTVTVDDAEAERLISLGYASAVVATGESAGFGNETLVSTDADKTAENGAECREFDEATLSEMTNPQLFKLATSLGLSPKPKAKKADMIALILSADLAVQEVADDGAEDGVEMPDVGAEAPI